MTIDAGIQRLRNSRVRLLSKFPFFGQLTMHLDLSVEPDPKKVPSACVSSSGRMRMGLEYMNGLSDRELDWVMCHEVLHVALRYWARQQHRTQVLVVTDKETGKPRIPLQTVSLWNIAHDYAINLLIEESIKSTGHPWAQAPKNVLLDTKYTGWAAEKIYDDILENTPEGDFSDFMSDALPGQATDEDDMRWKQAILHAAASHRGRNMALPDALRIIVEAIGKPKVAWQERFAQWVGDTIGRADYSYRRPSRRSEAAKEILCTSIPQGMPQITILWDTSGSMGGEHNAILVEVVSILEETSAPIRVVTCDTQVRGETNTRDIAEIVTVVEGGGGSDFNPAFEYVAPSLTWDTIIIAMTDGHINVPKEAPACQASLWLLTPDGVDPTGGRWGDVIRLDRP